MKIFKSIQNISYKLSKYNYTFYSKSIIKSYELKENQFFNYVNIKEQRTKISTPTYINFEKIPISVPIDDGDIYYYYKYIYGQFNYNIDISCAYTGTAFTMEPERSYGDYNKIVHFINTHAPTINTKYKFMPSPTTNIYKIKIYKFKQNDKIYYATNGDKIIVVGDNKEQIQKYLDSKISEIFRKTFWIVGGCVVVVGIGLFIYSNF